MQHRCHKMREEQEHRSFDEDQPAEHVTERKSLHDLRLSWFSNVLRGVANFFTTFSRLMKVDTLPQKPARRYSASPKCHSSLLSVRRDLLMLISGQIEFGVMERTI